jgi:hypothetical protein
MAAYNGSATFFQRIKGRGIPAEGKGKVVANWAVTPKQAKGAGVGVGAVAASWSVAKQKAGAAVIHAVRPKALWANRSVKAKAAVIHASSASGPWSFVSHSFAYALRPGFPNQGDFYIYEVVGMDATPLSQLPARWFYERNNGADSCNWQFGAKPELNDMPSEIVDYGAPFTGPGQDPNLWIDACPFDAGVSFPQTGTKDIVVNRTVAPATPPTTTAQGNVQPTVTVVDIKNSSGLSGNSKGFISSPWYFDYVSLLTNTQQVTRNGLNKFRGSYEHKPSAEIRLTDSTGKRGLALGVRALLRSSAVSIEADPDSGAPIALPSSLTWTAEVQLYIEGVCDFTSPTSPRRLLASQVITGSATSQGGGIVPVIARTETFDAAFNDASYRYWDGKKYVDKIAGSGTAHINAYLDGIVDPRAGQIINKVNIHQKTQTYFELPTVVSLMQTYLDSLASDMRRQGGLTGWQAFPWFGDLALRVRKEGNRITLSILPESIAPLTWEDPFVDRVLVVPPGWGTATPI